MLRMGFPRLALDGCSKRDVRFANCDVFVNRSRLRRSTCRIKPRRADLTQSRRFTLEPVRAWSERGEFGESTSAAGSWIRIYFILEFVVGREVQKRGGWIWLAMVVFACVMLLRACTQGICAGALLFIGAVVIVATGFLSSK
jgi:hypothetical protein